MDVAETLEGHAQAELAWSLKCNTVQQSHSTNLIHHFIARERLTQPSAQVIAQRGRAFAQMLPLQDVQRGEPRTHRQIVLAKSRGVNDSPLQGAIHGIVNTV